VHARVSAPVHQEPSPVSTAGVTAGTSAAATSGRRERRPWMALLGVAVSVVSLAGVVGWALGQKAPTLPDTTGRWAALAGAIGVYGVATCLRGERWLGLLRHNGAAPARADAWSLIAVGYMGNNVLPARAGDAFRVVFLTPRARTDARTVIGTLLAERVLDVVVLGCAFLGLTYGAVDHGALPSGGRVRLAVGALVVLEFAAAIAAIVLHRRGHLARVWAWLLPMAAATARLRGRHGLAMLAVTLVIWSLEACVWWCAGEAAGLGLTALEACYLLAVASMFSMIPSGPGYAGTMDAAVVFGARVLDRAPSAALSYLLLLRFVLFVPITLAGLVVLVARFGGWSRLRRLRR
jgi:glycosyltransferase 2 family protein